MATFERANDEKRLDASSSHRGIMNSLSIHKHICIISVDSLVTSVFYRVMCVYVYVYLKYLYIYIYINIYVCVLYILHVCLYYPTPYCGLGSSWDACVSKQNRQTPCCFPMAWCRLPIVAASYHPLVPGQWDRWDEWDIHHGKMDIMMSLLFVCQIPVD